MNLYAWVEPPSELLQTSDLLPDLKLLRKLSNLLADEFHRVLPSLWRTLPHCGLPEKKMVLGTVKRLRSRAKDLPDGPVHAAIHKAGCSH